MLFSLVLNSWVYQAGHKAQPSRPYMLHILIMIYCSFMFSSWLKSTLPKQSHLTLLVIYKCFHEFLKTNKGDFFAIFPQMFFNSSSFAFIFSYFILFFTVLFKNAFQFAIISDKEQLFHFMYIWKKLMKIVKMQFLIHLALRSQLSFLG